MNRKFLYALLTLVVASSIGFASQNSGELQGAFSSPGRATDLSSILHVSSNTNKKTSLTWNDGDVNTLGVWTVKADQNLTVTGSAFHLGAPLSVGSGTDESVVNFFENCTATLSSSGVTVETDTASDCNFAYASMSLSAGKTYTLTLTGSPISDALESFWNGDYNGKQVTMTLIGLTKSDGTVVHYYDSTLPGLVEQKSSLSITDDDNKTYGTYTLEYTNGGYTVESATYMTANVSNIKISATDQTIKEEQNTAVKTNTSTIPQSATTMDALLSAIGVTVNDSSAITNDLTITISAGGKTVKITSGSSTKTCTTTSSGNYSCKIP